MTRLALVLMSKAGESTIDASHREHATRGPPAVVNCWLLRTGEIGPAFRRLSVRGHTVRGSLSRYGSDFTNSSQRAGAHTPQREP